MVNKDYHSVLEYDITTICIGLRHPFPIFYVHTKQNRFAAELPNSNYHRRRRCHQHNGLFAKTANRHSRYNTKISESVY